MAVKNASMSQDEEKQEVQRQQETSKAAKKSLNAERKARELTQAAMGAGDPDERHKLLNEALNKEVEAETFGKTAKYLQSGTFQGLLAGTGLGGGIGIWLGVLTGTLVGGTTGILTGGLGAAIGAGVGAVHGAWFKVGDWMGDSIRKITGDIPGWKATEEQKIALEKMINGVKETERPSKDELMDLCEGGGNIAAGKAYTGQRLADERQKGLLQGNRPSVPDMPLPGFRKKKQDTEKESGSKAEGVQNQKTNPINRRDDSYDKFAGKAVTSSSTSSSRPSNIRTESTNELSQEPTRRTSSQTSSRQSNVRRSSRIKQEVGSTSVEGSRQQSFRPDQPKKKPRKLEVRS